VYFVIVFYGGCRMLCLPRESVTKHFLLNPPLNLRNRDVLTFYSVWLLGLDVMNRK